MMMLREGGTGAGQRVETARGADNGVGNQGSETKGFLRGEGRMAGEEIAKERERVRRVDQ